MSSPSFNLFCVAMLGMMLLQAPFGAKADINCDQVKKDLAPCMAYFTLGWLLPQCCPAIQGVISKATTRADRQSVCRCITAKSDSSDIAKAQRLGEACHVGLTYSFDSKFDCSMVK